MLAGARLRPGPAAAAWLDRVVKEAKGGDPLAPVTVIVPSNYAGLAQRHRMAAGTFANVRMSVVARLAEMAGAPALAARGLVPLTPVTEEAAIRAAIRAVGGLGPQTDHRAVMMTLRSVFRDLAESGVDAEQERALSDRSELARVAMAAHVGYRGILAEKGFYDAADLCTAAIERLAAGDAAELLVEWGPVVLFLPTRLGAPELALIRALAAAGQVEAGLPWVDDAIGDAEPRRWAARLGLDWDSLPGEAGTAPPPPEVLAAPDAGEEVRAAVRRILDDLENHGIPLHRTALVYRNQEPYQQLVRETLRAAQLPFVGLDGRPISESYAGRGLLGLLHLQGERFSRASVLNWISSLPHGDKGPTLAQWDRISRQAGVVRTVRQWVDRLQLKIAEDLHAIEHHEAQGDDSTLALRSYLRSQVDAAEQMQRRIREMDRRTRPPEAGGWPALVKWARELREALLPVPASWPQDQVEAAQMVDETLEGLLAAAPLDPEVQVDRFVETLDEALRARRRPQGRLGNGVVTGPVSAIAGMAFDRIHLLGMNERAYPAPQPVDPIFPWEASSDPLGREARRVAAERLAFLGAVAASGSAVLCLPTHDTEQRPAYPARWLLDAVATLAGRRIGPAELRELADAPERPWFTSLVSTESALRRGPVMLNLAERRVKEAGDIVRAGGDLGGSALAARTDLPLGRGLLVAGARASDEFTEFDGNVDRVAASLEKLASGLSRLHPISPSGLETWASCPFRYFLGRVLEVEPTKRPEDEEGWSISALDRGSLIHKILEEFFGALQAEGRPQPQEGYTRADRERLETIAQVEFKKVEDLGQTGYRLAWLNEQSAILLDLNTLLKKDEVFRAEMNVRPEHFETGFGWQEGWPAAEVALSDGTVVRLRGYIDRVDLGDQTAYVTDYKTGAVQNRAEFEADPVVAGTKVQLAVYSNAVRRHLAEAGLPIGSVTAAYWYISSRANFGKIEMSDPVLADRRLAEVVDVVNQGLTAGSFPQVPGEENSGMPKRPGWSNCVFCDYHRVCPTGRDQIRERKKLAPGAGIVDGLALR